MKNKAEYSALELYKNKIEYVPKLLDPFFQTVGIASLVGTSDAGKSTFLRQLSIAIALGLEEFMGFKLESKHNRVIYVSTEDNPISISPSIKRQIKYFKKKKLVTDDKHLSRLNFIFETENLLITLANKLENEKVDLIVIDAFTDVFSKEINANTQVRHFLNSYDRLAKKHECLIVFLHHIGKRKDKGDISKDNIIGSQAFEAKMRAVIELRPRRIDKEDVELWVLKSNFLQHSEKSKSYVLKFQEGIFENTGLRTGMNANSKINDTEIINMVLELKNNGLSVRKIETKLKGTKYEISKSTAQSIITDHTKN